MKKCSTTALRIAALLMAISVLSAAGAQAAVPFPDVVETDWYYYAVSYLQGMGVINGRDDGTFGAEETLEASHFLKMLGCVLYPEEIEGSSPGRKWADRFYDAAVAHGITDAYSLSMDTLYTSIDRYSVSVIIKKCLDNILKEEITIPEDISDHIGDDGAIPEKYREAVYAAHASGIINGYDDGAFHGEQTLTRAQAAQIILKMIRPSMRLKQSKPSPEPPGPSDGSAVMDDWFSDAVFFGDSLTHGLSLYSGLTTPRYYHYTGASVFSASSVTYSSNRGSGATLSQALTGTAYKKVYLLFGINELGSAVDKYINYYSELIDKVRQLQPGADIYIQTVLPVSAQKEASSTYFTNRNVNRFNEALEELVKNKQCILVDVNSAMKGSDGCLPASWTWDGVHLNSKYYAVWADYLKSHTGG